MNNQIQKTFYASAICLLLSVALFTACKPKEENTTYDNNVETTDKTPSDWQVFKESAEKSIAENDEQIKMLQEKISKSKTPNLDKIRQKRIDGLKEENARLRTEIVEYKEGEVQSDMEEFKSNVQQKLDSIKKDLKDFGDKFDNEK